MTTAPLQGPRSIGISFDILSKLFCIPKGELHLRLHSVHVGYIFLKYKYIIVYFNISCKGLAVKSSLKEKVDMFLQSS